MKALLLALCLTCFTTARGHDPALTGIAFVLRGKDTLVTVSGHLSRMALEEGVAVGNVRSRLDEVIRRRLHVTAAGKEIAFPPAHIVADSASDNFSWQADVSGRLSDVRVRSRLYPEDPGARTLVSVYDGGTERDEALLDQDNPSYPSAKAAGPVDLCASFFRQGVGHILGGADHILFVAGLLLLGGSLKSLIKTVTAFTVAHSVTLTLAVTGLVHPASRIVEPMIALSIVAVALENLRRKGAAEGECRDFRPLIAFGFGLIHGLGFAGALADIRLHGPSLAWALGSFNIGVEAGQACIIFTALPILALVRSTKPEVWQKLAYVGSLAISTVGAYWFVGRLFGAS